jgi:hypothetical protein
MIDSISVAAGVDSAADATVEPKIAAAHRAMTEVPTSMLFDRDE